MTRIAVIKKDKCNPVKCGELCAKVCPVNRMGEDCIRIDAKAQIDEVLCTGCGICPKKCPYDAIMIINLPEALKEDPIHQHGQNGFRLFSLPTPVFGKVVGLLGKNGIGKSTALKVIAGLLKPNLGQLDKEATYNELISHFKGSEAQAFFENLRDGNITVSYKPQEVELIPKTVKGTVRDLLKKVDEKGKFDEYVEKLELTRFLDNDIDKISGGELQRVAICASVMKKANLYMFDEPTSYLDIKQRIKVSKFIRELADEDTAVLVIEHDLIILDYMTDLIHLMYGKAGGYGIVSLPKTTRVAINVYLEGYLREENVRFRDYEIKFHGKPIDELTKDIELVSWNDIDEIFGKFKLHAGEGTINQNEVIGILGENGIGKTSFVKTLAENNKSLEDVKLAYKPQYLDKTEDLVIVYLQNAIDKYHNSIIRPLEIEPLYEKTLNQLSGGELQRVCIAKILAEDAELYLLDEPSAYLDAEQRLIVSKVIKEMMVVKDASCLVVDHDLLFIDYLSDRLLVFEGVPAISGEAKGPFSMQDGMNNFLRELNMTFRRDPDSNRPRANKPESQMDRQQKSENKLYYI
ncbi:ribosome biogenesis/translation initiation ATPase RLI [Candidatus Woesearchaeota archaeon]|nr:MAG: ribosome biogenesis/translation initiation ATPase RLI [Candidatus Woesearchaeota archaeon]